MTSRDDDLGRTLRVLLLEEADAMQIDVQRPAQRLRREMTQLDRKRRRGVIALAAVAAVAAVVIGFAFWTDQGPKSAPPPADEPTVTDGPAIDYFLVDVDTRESRAAPEWLSGTGASKGFDFSPDGSRVAWCEVLCPLYGIDSDRLMVADADGSDPVEVPAPDGLRAYLHDWSPDGTKLLVRFREAGSTDLGNLFVHDLTTGRNTQLTDVHHESGSQATSAEFSADGQTVLYDQIRSSGPEYGYGQFDVWSVPVTGGEPTLVIRNAVHAHYLADGETIVFVQPVTNSYDGHQIRLFTPEGEKRTIATVEDTLWMLQISPDRTHLAYYDQGATYVIPATGGQPTKVTDGHGMWIDDRTMLVS